MDKGHAVPNTGLTEEQRILVREQVQRVLSSPAFRNSARCSEFLLYISEKVLEGRDDDLHERCIGMDLFGKPPSYDPSEDSLVRVKASDVRRRLAQYYSESDRRNELKLILPAGSYVLTFGWPDATALSASAHGGARPRFRWRYALAGLAGVSVTLAVTALFWRSPTPLESFWEPVLHSSQPVMITLGNSPVYALSQDASARYFRDHPPAGRGPHSIPPDPSFALRASELVPQQGQYVGVGGAQAVLRYASYLSRLGKEAILRTGTGYSFSDLRDHPTVMVGAFSSEWTLRAASQMRFHFTSVGNMRYVGDRQTGNRWGLDPFANWTDLTDYVIVARVFPSGSGSGELVIIAAGITQYGAATASEFLTDPKYFSLAVADAPANWQHRNMEFVLRAKVVAGTPAPPEVVARHFW